MEQIGWCGMVGDKPFYENVTDEYSLRAEFCVAVNVYRSKKEAKKRFQEVFAVYIKTQK
jgi:hypothetical protein